VQTPVIAIVPSAGDGAPHSRLPPKNLSGRLRPTGGLAAAIALFAGARRNFRRPMLRVRATAGLVGATSWAIRQTPHFTCAAPQQRSRQSWTAAPSKPAAETHEGIRGL